MDTPVVYEAWYQIMDDVFGYSNKKSYHFVSRLAKSGYN
jgi:hypothetical protein